MIHPSGCGILGILKRENSPKIPGYKVLRAIERVRYRGSNKGAGFAVFNHDNRNYYIAKAFYFGDRNELLNYLKDYDIDIKDYEMEHQNENYCSCKFYINSRDVIKLRKLFRNINEILWNNKMKGRIYSVGSSLQVFKGVGYPSDVAKVYNIENVEGDLWLAHTRQPTNSPGYFPYWSHPFSGFNIAIVHNGDISSFGANMEFLSSRGWGGFVGTDSEVIAFLFEELINEGLDVEDAVRILVNPSKRQDILSREMEYLYRGARLDGPFTAVIAYDSGEDLYLIGLADRSKFRPVIIGRDDNYYYIASEENEIREISPNAKVWTLKPGSYFIASMKRGIISLGRSEEEVNSFSPPPTIIPEKYDILATDMSYKELNIKIAEMLKYKDRITIGGVMGHRFIGINLPRLGISRRKIVLYGIVGNALANLNESNEFYVYGNVADDCGDTMHGGKIVIMGDARDVLAQTFQNGRIFVRGNAGNRVGIQMREYKDKRPYLVIGGMVDDYLGEYMAGGVILVLGINVKREPVGNYIGTGMVGGRIYIRGKVSPSKIGLQPNRTELLNLLKALLVEGYLSLEELETLKDKSYIDIMDKLRGEAKKFAVKLFEEKVGIPRYEYRELTEEEFKELLPVVSEYSYDVGVDATEYLKEKFTVITARRK